MQTERSSQPNSTDSTDSLGENADASFLLRNTPATIPFDPPIMEIPVKQCSAQAAITPFQLICFANSFGKMLKGFRTRCALRASASKAHERRSCRISRLRKSARFSTLAFFLCSIHLLVPFVFVHRFRCCCNKSSEFCTYSYADERLRSC